MRAKLPFKKGAFDGKIFNENNEEISIDEITKGCEVQAILDDFLSTDSSSEGRSSETEKYGNRDSVDMAVDKLLES